MTEDKKTLIQKANKIMTELRNMPHPATLTEEEELAALQRREELYGELDVINAELNKLKQAGL